MGIPEGDKKAAESLFKEIIAETFLNLGKELDIQIHKANRSPYYSNTKGLIQSILY